MAPHGNWRYCGVGRPLPLPLWFICVPTCRGGAIRHDTVTVVLKDYHLRAVLTCVGPALRGGVGSGGGGGGGWAAEVTCSGRHRR